MRYEERAAALQGKTAWLAGPTKVYTYESTVELLLSGALQS